MQKTFEILLDIEKDLYTPSALLFNVSTNDFETVELLFTIKQDEAGLDLTGTIVELAIRKPSGLVVYQTVEITDADDGKAAAKLSLQAYVEFGVHAAEIYVRNESQIMVTCPFYYFSREAIMDGEQIESSGDWSALQEVLFSMDKKPILVDGIPAIAPEYIGQMAFDTGENKRAFIANGLTETNWQVLGAGEGGGGIVDWNSILGKPAAFPPEIHTHDFVDIQGKPDAYPPESHNHEILDVNGLQAALDAKADDADLAGLQTALDGKADDADLIPFITESEADVKYALKSEIDGGGGAWGEITGTISAQTDLQAALDAKADDADLAGKANTADLAAKVNSADVYLKTETFTKTEINTALAAKADVADLAAKADVADLAAKADVADLATKANNADVYPKTDTYNKTEVDAALTGKADAAALAGKVDDADLVPYITEVDADLKYEAKGQGATGAAWGEITGTISAQADLQAALDGKADAADLAAKADAADLAAKANSADVYAKTDTYNKTEVDAIVTGITEGGGTVVQDNLVSTSSSAALAANQGRILNETKANVADLAAKADVADLAAKADAADLAAKANSVDVYAKTATYSKTEVDTALTGKANTADLAAKADVADLATKSDIGHTHNFLDLANLPDAYTPTAHQHPISDITNLQATLDAKADDADLAAKANTADLAAKANSADVYAKTETYNKTEIDTALTGKANTADLAAKADDADLATKANSADVYLKTETFTKTEVNTALAAKADDADLAAYITEADADLKYEPIGAGGGGAWGEITGTLSAQTDLQAALDAKADDADLTGKANVVHTHAIADVTGLQTALDGKITATYADAGDNFIMNTRMAGLTLWKGTQAAYDGLTPDSNTLYFITG